MIGATGAVAIRTGGEQFSREWLERFRSAVLAWSACNGRDFPWRHTSNPFHILIAEVLLRQTQAERVVRPYLELIERYPDPPALANADARGLREWFRPLGLVRRADRLIKAAQLVVGESCGHVPGDLNVLLGLPGVGTYSARAVLCLAFGARVPMVDEGSGRVLRRLLSLAPTGPAYSNRTLLNKAEQIVPESCAREFNLGLIDIAAAVCRPRVPACVACPLVRVCCFASVATEKERQPNEARH